MIVDDCYLIIGSANINDRSMLGSRDSEIAVFIEGPPTKKVFTGFDYMMVNEKIHDFRKRLFEEHFGIEVESPTSNEMWHKLYNISVTNTQIFNKVFKTYPSNEYSTFEQLSGRNKNFDPDLFVNEIAKISGNVVLYPYLFLKEENLIGNRYSEISLLAVPIHALY